ncbi:MAG: YfhO family protein, partial [Acidobacteriota bacterium]|nr:YfhO family protein [Acidobacteriota bacterium]
MAKERLKRLASSSNVPGFLAFALPALILFIGFQTAGVFPFGDRHILTIDLFHQYAPFLAEYRRKLLSFGTLQFSWNGGLGIDFYSLFAYYLSSPLNLLIVLFPESQLSNFVLFSVVLKTGLAGYTGYFYLRRGRAHTPWVSVVFAMGYALSSFTLAYFWNIMWLDVIVLLPILAYTALLLVREERIAPYVITLAVTLFVNYYVAFFAALFIALYFLVLLVENVPFKRWKDQLAKLVLFAGASTLSAALSAVLILPVYLKLQTTSASGDAWPEELKFTFSPLDLTARMMYATEPAVRSGLPNIYAGVLVLLFIPVYFLARKISMRAKLANAALLAVLVLSLSVNSLNFFWHGMHYPNQLPHRFAFVVVFLLVVMAADAFRAYRETGGTIVIKSAVGLGFLAVLLNRLDGELVSGRTMFITILLMVIYTAFVTVLVKRSKPGQSAALGDDVAGASDRATVRVGANRELVELQGVESAATTVENAERHSAAHKRGKRKPAFFAKVGSVQGARVLAVALISVVSLEFLVSTALG